MLQVSQTKSEFLVDSLIEILNDEWKVLAIENGHTTYTQLEVEVGRKYIKLWSYLVSKSDRIPGRSVFMFVENVTGNCYKPAGVKAPAKGVRYNIEELLENPYICDQYGSFLYVR